MCKDLIRGIGFVSILLTTALWAENDDEHRFDTKFSGYTYIEAGEVVKGIGWNITSVYDHRWISDACVGIFAATRIDEHLKVLMGFEGQLAFPFNTYAEQPNEELVYTRNAINSFWVSQGEGIYTFGDLSGTSLEIEAGYFPYKYNQEVRNLGEYLFRTYCYPPIMLNLFDRTFTELMGVRVGNTLGGLFHHDLILHSESKQYPFNDFSLSYLADINNPELLFVMPHFITLGGGIQFYRMITVREELDFFHGHSDANLISRDTVAMRYNPATQDTQPVISEQWMGFPGTKVMGRATVDFKKLLPQDISDLLGKEALKVYGEIAVLGWKNYEKFYEDRSQRMPMTLGCNSPTLKIFHFLNIGVLDKIIDMIDLDILNGEIEYLNSIYWNSTYQVANNMIPLQDQTCDSTSILGKHEKLKWSLYAKKLIGKRMTISAQVANDHLIPKSSHARQGIQDYHDVTLRHGDWWWNFRARFDF
jgi:hypothetical protein